MTQAPLPAPTAQPRNPLHGVTLEAMVVALSEHFGWEGLGARIPVRCFQSDPSVALVLGLSAINGAPTSVHVPRPRNKRALAAARHSTL